MLQYSSINIVILCLAVQSPVTNGLKLISPCPTVFNYEGEPQSDRWYGTVAFSSNVELVSLTYKIQLDNPAELLVSWDGEVCSNDNMEFSIYNPYHFQRAGELKKSRIMVKYSPTNNPPRVVKIIINGVPMCSYEDKNEIALTATNQHNERPDPIFHEDAFSAHSRNLNDQTVHSDAAEAEYSIRNSKSNERESSPASFVNSDATDSHVIGARILDKNPSYSNSDGKIKFDTGSNPDSSKQSSRIGNNPQSQQFSNMNDENNMRVPTVTTLTLPSDKQNSSNMNTIVNLIKNRLEQEGTLGPNKTVIFTILNPVNSPQVGGNVSGPRDKDGQTLSVQRANSSSISSANQTNTRAPVKSNKN